MGERRQLTSLPHFVNYSVTPRGLLSIDVPIDLPSAQLTILIPATSKGPASIITILSCVCVCFNIHTSEMHTKADCAVISFEDSPPDVV